jgi:hypothetical protein
MRPPGSRRCPVRPLRLSPMTATAGGRASVTPGTRLHQLAAVTRRAAADAGPAPSSRCSSMKPGKIMRTVRHTQRAALFVQVPPRCWRRCFALRNLLAASANADCDET